MSLPLPLLQTKLYVPPLRSSVVRRTRLWQRLTGDAMRPFTLISAPAGFGKTTLVVEWIHQMQSVAQGGTVPAAPVASPRVAWFSMDEDDNDPIRFLTYLLAALQQQQTTLGDAALTLLRTPPPPLPKTILTLLLNELNQLDAPLILVLDDYHVITAQPVHEALTFLLDHMPPHFHLVLTTRLDPPLPLARWRVRQGLVEIRADDLRFTLEEAATLLNDVMGLPLSPREVAQLEARTEGWIAGLHLAVLSMQGRRDLGEFVQQFTGSHAYIVDYLLEEVLQRQPVEVQEFLLQTSILERLCGALCDALCGNDQGQILLEQLQRSNLFLVPLDDARRWYRYHHLFADVLRNRLQHLYPGRSDELHRRAATWLAENGWPHEAVQHALLASEFSLAADLMEQNADTLLNRGEQATLRTWLQRLPDHVVYNRPRLLLAHAKGLVAQHQMDGAQHMLDAAQKALGTLDATARQHTGGAILATRAQIALLQGDAAQTTALAGQALDALPETARYLRGEVLCDLGVSQMWQGQLERAGANLAEAVRLCQEANNIHSAIRSTYNLAALYHLRGQLAEMAALDERVLQLAEFHGLSQSPILGLAYADLSELWYEWNDLERAWAYVEQAIQLGQRYVTPRSLASAYVIQAVVARARGDWRTVERARTMAEQLIQIHQLPLRYQTPLSALDSRLWLDRNDCAAASAWIESTNLDLTGDLIPIHDLDYLTLARAWLILGEYEPAEELLIKLRHAAQAGGRLSVALASFILQSVIAWAAGEAERALECLTEALVLAHPSGYIRLFVDYGTPMRELLLAHQAQYGDSSLREYTQTLLDAFAPLPARSAAHPPTTPPADALIEPLSARELEILTLVAAGLSNSQIAEQLVITVGTVKRHLNNIFGKLDVRSRTQAVVRGRTAGLLS